MEECGWSERDVVGEVQGTQNSEAEVAGVQNHNTRAKIGRAYLDKFVQENEADHVHFDPLQDHKRCIMMA
jgi:hypothetical protein